MIGTIKSFYDLIDSLEKKYKDDKAKIIKIQREKRHFDEWLEDQERQKPKEHDSITSNYNERGILQSGMYNKAIEEMEQKYSRNIERKILDVKDIIALIELGNL